MHAKTSLQSTLSIDDTVMLKPTSGMKLITIEEPQKTILEPLNEAAESPLDKSPTETLEASLGGTTQDPSPILVENVTKQPPRNVSRASPRPRRGVIDATKSPISSDSLVVPTSPRSRKGVTEPPSHINLSPEKPILQRTKSGEKKGSKTTRIRTNSRVETAL